MSKADKLYKKYVTEYADYFLHGELAKDRPAWCLCSGYLPHQPRCFEYKEALEKEALEKEALEKENAR